MLDILIAAIFCAAVSGLGVWCLMEILERNGPDEGRTPQADLTGGTAQPDPTPTAPGGIRRLDVKLK